MTTIERKVDIRMRWGAALALACLFGCEPSLPVPEAPACALRETTFEVAVSNVDPVDVLIVLDVSPSMAGEQQALARKLPELVRVLVSGELPDGSGFPPVRDLHIGVVSADLGAGANADGAEGCTARGDDGAFARGEACGPELPPFADYFDPRATLHPLVLPPSREAAEALIEDTACRLQLGSDGCGRSQPLEAMLHGLESNPGFLRSDPARGLSFVFVLLISDGDDCSLRDPDAAPPAPGDEDAVCSARPELLHMVQRYVDGLRALRPGNESMVALSAIVGLPPDFTTASSATVDWNDTRDREAFYTRLLADPRMQPQLRADGTLTPVCENGPVQATPAPRIVNAVRGLGTPVALHSICEDDWTPALAPLVRLTSKQLHAGCYFPLPRGSNGLTPCRMLWELPLPDRAHRNSPTRCEDLPFLSPHQEQPISAEGRPQCEVHQLAVEGKGDDRRLESGGGWFYDDFTQAVCNCSLGARRCGSLVFVPNEVPNGVSVHMNCFETLYVVPSDSTLKDVAKQPDVFEPCDPNDPLACARTLDDPTGGPAQDGFDHRLRCDDERAQCVLFCTDASRCPTGWSCSDDQICEPGECRVPG